MPSAGDCLVHEKTVVNRIHNVINLKYSFIIVIR